MSLQEIIVIAVVFFCVNYVGVRIVNYFRDIKRGKNPCDSCSGCELQRMHEEKKRECARNNPKEIKK